MESTNMDMPVAEGVPLETKSVPDIAGREISELSPKSAAEASGLIALKNLMKSHDLFRVDI